MSFTPQPSVSWPPPAPQPGPQPAPRITPTWPPPAPRPAPTWPAPAPQPASTWAAPQPPSQPVLQPPSQLPSQPSPPQPPPQTAPQTPATWAGSQPTWQSNTPPAGATFTPDTHRIIAAGQPSGKASPFAWVVLVAGLGALGASLMPYYTVVSTIDWLGVPHTKSFTGNAWFGVYGWVAAVLLACGAAAAAMYLAYAKTRRPFAIAAVLLSVAGLFSALIVRVVYPDITNFDLVEKLQWFTVDKQYAYGYWVGLGCAIVATVAAVIVLLGAMRKPTSR